jgi:ElaB/YqjD/DUF883 family membrane-anchored ribosome-binding protein
MRPSIQSRLTFLVMILCLGSLLLLPGTALHTRAAPAAFSITSLLGLDDLARKTLNQIDQAMTKAQGIVHEELDHLHAQVSDIINQLESTYKDVLNVTISSLDTETQRLAVQLSNMLDDVNTRINQDIDHAQDALARTLQQARVDIGNVVSQLEGSLSRLIVQVTDSAVFVLDRAAWNTLGIGAVALLLLGLIIIPAVIISAKGWPKGLGGWIAALLVITFLAVGSLLAFVPAAKAQALKLAGKGKEAPTVAVQPQVFDVTPDPVILGRTQDLIVEGVHLAPKGTLPAVTLGGKPEVVAGGDMNLKIALPTTPDSRTMQLRLIFSDNTSFGAPVTFATMTPVPAPAQVVMSDFRLNPDNPTAQIEVVHASVRIANRGGTASKPFVITWTPQPGGMQETRTIQSLPPNSAPQLFEIADGNIYERSGTFQTEMRSSTLENGANPVSLTQMVTVNKYDPVLQSASVTFITDMASRPAPSVLDIIISSAGGENLAFVPAPLATFDANHPGEVTLFFKRTVTRSDLANGSITLSYFPVPNNLPPWIFHWSLKLNFAQLAPQTLNFGPTTLWAYSLSAVQKIMIQTP